MPSYLRDSDEVSQHESIVDHSAVVEDIKHADDKADYVLEKEIPSPYFELPKKAHARLATMKAIHVKFPTPELSDIKLAEPKSNPSSRYAPPEYIKPPNL